MKISNVLWIQVLLVIMLGVLFTTTARSQETNKYEGIVIFQIENLNSEVYQKIQEAIATNTNMSFEYGCIDTEIIVIKFANSGFSSKADNTQMVKNQFRKCVKKHKVTVIFERVNQFTGNSQCQEFRNNIDRPQNDCDLF